jgi:DNA-binding transcriptional regulator YiaG
MIPRDVTKTSHKIWGRFGKGAQGKWRGLCHEGMPRPDAIHDARPALVRGWRPPFPTREAVTVQSVIDGIRIAPLDRRMGRKPLEQPRNWSGTVGRHWVRLRRKLFATQAEFAAALTRNGLKVTTPTVSEWERGFRMPNLSDLLAIAATLEVPVQSLIPSKAFLTKFCDSQN